MSKEVPGKPDAKGAAEFGAFGWQESGREVARFEAWRRGFCVRVGTRKMADAAYLHGKRSEVGTMGSWIKGSGAQQK